MNKIIKEIEKLDFELVPVSRIIEKEITRNFMNEKLITAFSPEINKKLEAKFREANLLRKMRVTRYDSDTILEYHVQSLDDKAEGNIKFKIDKFVGGGFAGQVYRVVVLENPLSAA